MQSSKYQYLITHFGDKLKDALIKDHHKIKLDTNDISNQNEYLKSGIDELLKVDPKKGKFIQAIIRWYVNHEFKLEDVQRLNEDLTFFNRVKNKIENKDLLTYDTLKSVYDAIRPFQENENDSKSNKELMREAKAGAKKLYQEPESRLLFHKAEILAKRQNHNRKIAKKHIHRQWCRQFPSGKRLSRLPFSKKKSCYPFYKNRRNNKRRNCTKKPAKNKTKVPFGANKSLTKIEEDKRKKSTIKTRPAKISKPAKPNGAKAKKLKTKNFFDYARK
jgi:hypothetical protein